MDFHTSSLDAYEARINRIEPLDLPALREYVQEHPGCDWEDACDWYEQITGRSVPEEQWGTIEEIWEEESQNWEPTDDEIMGAFGTPGMTDCEDFRKGSHSGPFCAYNKRVNHPT